MLSLGLLNGPALHGTGKLFKVYFDYPILESFVFPQNQICFVCIVTCFVYSYIMMHYFLVNSLYSIMH